MDIHSEKLNDKKSIMKNILLGLLCSFLPVYSFITWIINFNNPSLKNQSERVVAYFKTYFLNLAINPTFLTLFNVLLLIISIYFLSKWKAFGKVAFFRNGYLLILGILVFFQIWTLL